MDYVIANRDGDPLSYTQFKRLWQYIVTRTAKPRMARKLVDGKYVKYMLYPKLGEKSRLYTTWPLFLAFSPSFG